MLRRGTRLFLYNSVTSDLHASTLPLNTWHFNHIFGVTVREGRFYTCPAEVNPGQSAVSLSPARVLRDGAHILFHTDTISGSLISHFSAWEMRLSFLEPREEKILADGRQKPDGGIGQTQSVSGPFSYLVHLEWNRCFLSVIKGCWPRIDGFYSAPSLHQNANEFNPITIIF